MVFSKACNSPQKQQGESWHLSQLVCLLMACVCSLPRDVSPHLELLTAARESYCCSVVSVQSGSLPPDQVEVPRTEQLLSQLEEMSCACEHRLSYTSAAKCFAGLVNKKRQGRYFGGVFLLKPAPGSVKTKSSSDSFVSSSDDFLDKLIHNTTERLCCELESPSSAVRTQAFTLMVWVRDVHFRWLFYSRCTEALCKHPAPSCRHNYNCS